MLTVSGDGTARVWVALPHGEWEGIALTGHTGPLGWGEFSPDGTRVVTACMDGPARIWDVRYDDRPGRLREATRHRSTAKARARLGWEVRGG